LIESKNKDFTHVRYDSRNTSQYAHDNNQVDEILKLMSLSRRICLTDVVEDFDSFIKLFKRSSFHIDKFLLESYITTEMTEQFGELKWEPN
jgi:hypothetical protein